MQTNGKPSQQISEETSCEHPNNNALGLTEADIEFIRQDMFEYSKKLGYEHDEAWQTAQHAVATLEGRR